MIDGIKQLLFRPSLSLILPNIFNRYQVWIISIIDWSLQL